ncbi:hypothetical protein SmJEL517_g00617 [Synchytrium microbalum]|uniref:Uncharacterized protein n=1 Tax=Synchytrium microbalum TaxID=1806994 RepID=A0A507CHM1_9FUNG|nr:uncharacterized protein SmJEL517_g00617 [Synchytrium microbalum]TPX37544.1 hypothetical protein SmJEL517_g00617 [Synchytrium microbalum]
MSRPHVSQASTIIPPPEAITESQNNQYNKSRTNTAATMQSYGRQSNGTPVPAAAAPRHHHERPHINSKTLLKKIAIAAVTLFVDLGLPIILYFILRVKLDPVYALLIAGIPPLLTVLVKLAIFRSFDMLGIMAFLAFTISAVIALATGDARILLLEKSVVTAVLGSVFLITLIPFHFDYKRKGEKKRFYIRPAIHFIVMELIPLETAVICPARGAKPAIIWDRWDKLYTTNKRYAFDVLVLTIVWGIVLFIEFLGRLFMVLSPLDVDQVVAYGNIWFAVVAALGALITVIYLIPMLKRFNPSLDKLEDDIEDARAQAGYVEEELVEIK